MSTLWFTIKLPADGDGFVGRACKERTCGRYFKVQGSSKAEKLHCPYCGTAGAISETHTPEQAAYAKRVLKEKARKHVHDEVQKMLKNTFGRLPRSGSVSFSFKPGPAYVEKTILPGYREQKVDTDLCCPDCGFTFQVHGIFGYCPKCRTENAQIYDTNLAIIRKELANPADQKRALRHAYGDLVSTVEMFCKNRAPALPNQKRPSFQRLADVEALALSRVGKKLDELLTEDELMALRIVFQKRHVYTHGGGVIDERYTREVPGTEHLVGTKAELSLEEFDKGAKAVHRLIGAMFLPPPPRHVA